MVGNERLAPDFLHSIDTNQLQGTCSSLIALTGEFAYVLLATVASASAALASSVKDHSQCDLSLLCSVTSVLSHWVFEYSSFECALLADIAQDLHAIFIDHPSLPHRELAGLLAALKHIEAPPAAPKLQPIFIDPAFHGAITFQRDVCATHHPLRFILFPMMLKCHDATLSVESFHHSLIASSSVSVLCDIIS